MKFNRLKKYFYYFTNNNFMVFVSLIVLIFFTFHSLLGSYFEADEWFHFTHYLPLTQNPFGSIIALTRSVTDANALSEGQHVVPIGEELFFLNVLIFGINFKPYAIISLVLHSVNSFLVFLLIKELLAGVKDKNSMFFAILGSIFFAFTTVPVHVITWAAFYGQNVLSVSFFLLSLLFLQKALNTKIKKYIYLSSLFLLLDLMTKETAIILVFIIPVMIFMNNKNFTVKFLCKIYAIPLAFFAFFRFIIPIIYLWIDQWIIASLNSVDHPSFTMVNKGIDLSLIIYRTITFPLSMISQVFIPGPTMLSFLKIISPLIYYQYAGEPAARGQNRLFFIYGPGQNLLYYLISFAILIMVIIIVRKYYKKNKKIEAKIVLLSLLILVTSAFPLVLNVLRIPSWGTDFFDSRHYYMPSVGAAILLPFLLMFVSEIIVKALKKIKISVPILLVLIILFAMWFINNLIVLKSNLNIIVDQTGVPRRKIITQLKEYLPILPQKAVFYAETDGGGAYGPVLPFQTSFPQILTVVYYDKNPLPNSFFNKFVFDAKPQGYMYSEERGFGFYNSRKSLLEALKTKAFGIKDVYAFYYDSKSAKLTNITQSIRDEMENSLKEDKLL